LSTDLLKGKLGRQGTALFGRVEEVGEFDHGRLAKPGESTLYLDAEIIRQGIGFEGNTADAVGDQDNPLSPVSPKLRCLAWFHTLNFFVEIGINIANCDPTVLVAVGVACAQPLNKHLGEDGAHAIPR
jgi:hypothetical protein